MSVSVDPATGLKVFDTRAAIATDKIRGKGYDVISDEALKTLPVQCIHADTNTKYGTALILQHDDK